MGEMLGAVIVMMKIKEDLCIFYKGRRRKDTRDRAINTDGSLVPVMINKVIFYRNLEEMRQSYSINNQDPYFFIREKLPPGTVIYPGVGYWTPWHTWISQFLRQEFHHLRMKYRAYNWRPEMPWNKIVIGIIMDELREQIPEKESNQPALEVG
jgi:hypothetical protein